MEARELKGMRDSVNRNVNSLELCWGCDRICECEHWVANDTLRVWLCMDCSAEVAYRLEKRSGVPVLLSHAGQEA